MIAHIKSHSEQQSLLTSSVVSSLCEAVHDGHEACSSLVHAAVQHRGVLLAQHVVQLEEHKAQQRGVELQEGHHDPEVHVLGQYLQAASCSGWADMTA